MFIKINQTIGYNKKFNLQAIVIEEIESKKVKNNEELKIYLISDETGCIEFGLFNCRLNNGDIIELVDAYVLEKSNKLRIFAGSNENITRIGNFRMLFNCEINYSNLNQS